MDIREEVVKATISATVGLLKDGLVNFFKSKDNGEEDFCARLSLHMREIASWSSNIQIIEMPAPMHTDKDTVMLPIRTTPRRLRRISGVLTDETVFLRQPNHYVLLGDPGSGKTTTMKRLVRYFFEEPLSRGDIFQYPVVLLLRDYDPQLGLLKSIAQSIGVRFQENRKEMPDGTIQRDAWIGDKPFREALSEILNTTKALLLLDGLDEVSSGADIKLIQQVNQLACCLDTAKIIITCRSGDFTQTLQGFQVVELSELSESQVQEISKMWLGDSEHFLKELTKVPYKDMAHRPLLLTQLLCIFSFEDELPSEPRTIYRTLLTLLLKEWDRSRGVKRKSKYAMFDSESKLDFLSALSYELTYKIKAKSFSEEQLIDCYKNICYRHRLPEGEAEEVVKEIETHTGIIVSASRFSFEFSHLSLQEYLCANYIVKEPRAGQIPSYIREYPPPLAIAIALASEPSMWFADMILKYGSVDNFTGRSLQTLISRIIIEKPRFVKSTALGNAMLHLYFYFYKNGDSDMKRHIEHLTELPYVLDSISHALGSFWILKPKSEPGDYFYLAWQHQIMDVTTGHEYKLYAPSQGYLPKNILLKALNQHHITMKWCEEWGSPGSRFVVKGGNYFYE